MLTITKMDQFDRSGPAVSFDSLNALDSLWDDSGDEIVVEDKCLEHPGRGDRGADIHGVSNNTHGCSRGLKKMTKGRLLWELGEELWRIFFSCGRCEK